VRYNERSAAERVNGRLKDDFGGRNVRVRGHAKVMPSDVRRPGTDLRPTPATDPLIPSGLPTAAALFHRMSSRRDTGRASLSKTCPFTAIRRDTPRSRAISLMVLPLNEVLAPNPRNSLHDQHPPAIPLRIKAGSLQRPHFRGALPHQECY
jgi:hypothetical protein